MKKLIAFDLDDTLSITKSPISPRMARLLERLLEKYEVCVISGGKIEQFHLQVVDCIQVSDELLSRLHLMPTCGTTYYRYNSDESQWQAVYRNDLTDDQKHRVTEALTEVAHELGIWPAEPAGEVIEDRGSQITMSALGQQATPEAKYAWAKKYADVRPVFRDKVAAIVPDLEVRIGGTTSTDVTMAGIDKAYGMNKLIELQSVTKDDILFIGDKLEEGGNDYPVKAMGIGTIAVDGWEDTAYVLDGILAVNQ